MKPERPLRPYLSVDIETTGLDSKRCNMIELGWVIDDGISSFANLERYNSILYHPNLYKCSVVALDMNIRIIQELQIAHQHKRSREIFQDGVKFPEEVLGEFCLAVNETVELAAEWDKKYDSRNARPIDKTRICLAGKNIGTFDIPFIERYMKEFEMPDNVMWDHLQHRTIDVGPMYFEDFGYVPNLSEINTLNNRAAVSHKAVEDADDVVYAVRKKYYGENLEWKNQ